MVKKVYWFRWMNRTRFEDEKGNYIIKTSPRYKDESKAKRDFEAASKNGYAVQMKSAEIVIMDCINFSDNFKMQKSEVEVKAQVIEENDRWKLRRKEKEITKLFRKKEQTEASLKAIKEKLKQLQEE